MSFETGADDMDGAAGNSVPGVAGVPAHFPDRTLLTVTIAPASAEQRGGQPCFTRVRSICRVAPNSVRSHRLDEPKARRHGRLRGDSADGAWQATLPASLQHANGGNGRCHQNGQPDECYESFDHGCLPFLS